MADQYNQHSLAKTPNGLKSVEIRWVGGGQTSMADPNHTAYRRELALAECSEQWENCSLTMRNA